jgi:glycosyltransferase involved in cell wall biosynthesis
VLEAFAAGLPVISTPAGDIGSMVQDGRTGILVPAEDPDAMAAAAASLLRRPDHALSIARRARAMVETRTWTAVRDQWLEAYRMRERAESPTVANGEMANG